MAGVLYLTEEQAVQIFGLNLFAVRFLELAGFVRVLLRREFSFRNLNGLDRALLMLYTYSTVVFLMRSTEGFAYQFGLAVDATFCYFTFRGMIRSIEEFSWFLRAFVVFLAPYFVLVLAERLTAHNPFVILGAEAQAYYFRNGWPRCMGSFRHPALLGTLGTSFLPLYIGLAFVKTGRTCAALGIGLCVGIVWLSNAGGPASAAAFGLAGWLFWIARKNMSMVRRGLVGLIVLLAAVMKAPVWYLPAKFSSFAGGDGWHRSYLLEVAIQNLDKWWLAGMSIVETQNWFPYHREASGGADITNQFLSFGLSAGLVAMALLTFLLIRGFQSLGKAMAAVRSGVSEASDREFLLWGLGVMLLVHVVTWFGVIYFDQIYVIWFMQLAAISSVSQLAAEVGGRNTVAATPSHHEEASFASKGLYAHHVGIAGSVQLTQES